MIKSEISTTPERSRLMAKVRRSGTSPEIAVRRIVRKLGFEFRTKKKNLPGTPDLANPKKKWVIFVHGCFWHAHEGCYKWTIPKRNRSFWIKKFSDNRNRDERKIAQLEDLGYSVLVVWECELEDEMELMEKIQKFLA